MAYNDIGKKVFDFHEDSSGTLWMATSKGLVRKNNDGTMQEYLFYKNVPEKNYLSNIVEDENHDLWISNSSYNIRYYNGLYRFNSMAQTFSSFHHEPGNVNTLASDTIQTLNKDTDNKIWIGTSNGLDLLDVRSESFKHYVNDPNDSNSLSHNYVRSIVSEDNDNVWVAVDGGINKLNKQTGHFKRYVFNRSVVFDLFKDSDGVVWVGTLSGLYRYNKISDNFIPFKDVSGVVNISTTVHSITEDHQNNLWLNTKNSMVRLNTIENEASVYEKNYGVSRFDKWSIYTRRNGEIVCGDTSGYFTFYSDSIFKNIPPPTLIVTRFLLSGQPIKVGTGSLLSVPIYQTKEIYLKYNQNTFSFEFTSIDFTNQDENTRILYILENYDPAWRKADADKIANYHDVPAGKYIFKIKAVNSNGIWAEKDIALTINPPWWRTWWAYTIFILLLVGLTWGFVYYRSRKLRQENRVLEEKVAIRTFELLREKEKVESTLNELKSTQAQLLQSEKMASLGELTAGIAHEIQNPLNFVNNFSEVNKELIEEATQANEAGNPSEVKELLSN